ncbi:ferredoxin [Nocardioides sp.]|jgi:ferredoxin|uniref:ferredoxin n=1 Tax=Nocardioides sp. TaxID=35761 RepID=UPI0026320A20|nr:ferredoxin [Nocardioides sp.]
MATRVVADLHACQGYANCLVNAPDVFDLSEEGKVAILVEDVSHLDRREIEDAVASCPAAALRLESA